MTSTLFDMLQNGASPELLPTAHSMLQQTRDELEKIVREGEMD
jgi:hypothetical protein